MQIGIKPEKKHHWHCASFRALRIEKEINEKNRLIEKVNSTEKLNSAK